MVQVLKKASNFAAPVYHKGKFEKQPGHSIEAFFFKRVNY